MIKIFEKIRTQWELNSSIKKTINSQETEPLRKFLIKNPDFLSKIAEIAIRKITYEPWNSIWLCLTLIQFDNDKAIEFLNMFLKSEFVGWKMVSKEHIQMILTYLRESNQTELYLKYIEKFGVKDFSVPLERMTLEQFDDWFNAQLNDKESFVKAHEIIINFLDGVSFSKQSDQDIKNGISNVFHAAMKLWGLSQKEYALEILKFISLVKPSQVDRNMVKNISTSLPQILPKSRPSIAVSDNNELSQMLSQFMNNEDFIPEISSGIVHGADILRLFPSIDWIDNIKMAWIHIAKYIRKACYKNNSKQIPLDLAMAGNSLLIALGVCIAQSKKTEEIESKDEIISNLQKKLVDNIKKRNDLVHKYNNLIDNYKKMKNGSSKKESALESKIKKLRVEIKNYETENEKVQADIQHNISPTMHLLNVLNNSQDYPDIIRQASAWGLYHILKNVKLSIPDKRNIYESLRISIFEGNWDDNKLKEEIKSILKIDDELLNDNFDIINEYIFDRSHSTLSGMYIDSASKKIFLDKLSDWLDKNFYSIVQEFAERPIYVFSKASFSEIRFQILDGLNWMVDIIEKHRDPELMSRFKDKIDQTVLLIKEYLPQASTFLSLYPIRLMDISHHQKMLGKYSYSKCDLIYWTRYSPPLWKPGMSPDEAGEVNQRYLSVNDRSTPNSMGIFYRLFEHPVLSLPVIYHEFLHFGGTIGRSENAINNESEVWIREIIFMQYIISKLAPKRENVISEYEQEIVNAINRLNLNGIGFQTQYDFSNIDILPFFCDKIERIYGKKTNKEKAIQKADERIERNNRSIQLMNRTHEVKLNWYPEIEWPYLNTDQTISLTDNYKSILINSMITDHRLTVNEYTELINEENIQFFITSWNKYKSKSVTMKTFIQNWPLIDYEISELITVIVDRFNITDDQAVNYFNHIIRELRHIDIID